MVRGREGSWGESVACGCGVLSTCDMSCRMHMQHLFSLRRHNLHQSAASKCVCVCVTAVCVQLEKRRNNNGIPLIFAPQVQVAGRQHSSADTEQDRQRERGRGGGSRRWGTRDIDDSGPEATAGKFCR